MATKTLVTMLDDIDGSEAIETMRFALDGVEYEIDLNGDHAHKLRDALARYATAGRKVGKGGRALRLVKLPAAHDLHAVRAWARSQGIDVADKGRVSQLVIDAYENRGTAKENSPSGSAVSPEKAEPVPEATPATFVEPTATSEAPTAEAPKKAPRKRAPRKAAAVKSAAS